MKTVAYTIESLTAVPKYCPQVTTIVILGLAQDGHIDLSISLLSVEQTNKATGNQISIARRWFRTAMLMRRRRQDQFGYRQSLIVEKEIARSVVSLPDVLLMMEMMVVTRDA
jgi:hypothetical protein